MHKHNRALKKAREQKKLAKKKLLVARSSGESNDIIIELSQKFHRAVRQYNKAIKESRNVSDHQSAQQEKRMCSKNIWRYAEKLFNDEDNCNIKPDFSASEGFSYFSHICSDPSPQAFSIPAWMKAVSPPSLSMNCGNITKNEIVNKLKKARNSSSPSPQDQVSYYILKRCPAIVPALVDLFNCCWALGSVPTSWKSATIKLIAKPAAKADANKPSNFRPIALTSCVGKLFTSILKDRYGVLTCTEMDTCHLSFRKLFHLQFLGALNTK